MEAIRTVQLRRVAVAREWLAGGALAAIVVLSYALAAGMASSATFFVTWSQRPGFGFPSWLAGPPPAGGGPRPRPPRSPPPPGAAAPRPPPGCGARPRRRPRAARARAPP